MGAAPASDRRRAPSPAKAQSPKSSVAWAPTQDLNANEWAAAGRRIGAVGRCIQWLLGDWIAYGNTKFGERYARAAKITGYDTQTLMNMVYVASRFEISRRRENLSWSHHETLAALDEEEQNHWLDQAQVNRWSIADLRMMLRVSRRECEAEEGEAETGVEVLTDSELDTVTRVGNATAEDSMVCPNCGYKLDDH